MKCREWMPVSCCSLRQKYNHNQIVPHFPHNAHAAPYLCTQHHQKPFSLIEFEFFYFPLKIFESSLLSRKKLFFSWFATARMEFRQDEKKVKEKDRDSRRQRKALCASSNEKQYLVGTTWSGMPYGRHRKKRKTRFAKTNEKEKNWNHERTIRTLLQTGNVDFND